jgi:crossover junction endodeoxyribonuclease RuvC
VIEAEGVRLRFVAAGVIESDDSLSLAERLLQLHDGLDAVIRQHEPAEAAVEESFVNRNPASTLKLGLARGVALLTPARAGVPVSEYPANLVKKSVVGAGHAAKEQIQMMVAMLLPGSRDVSADAADALAVAICHAHHTATTRRWAQAASAAALGERPL